MNTHLAHFTRLTTNGLWTHVQLNTQGTMNDERTNGECTMHNNWTEIGQLEFKRSVTYQCCLRKDESLPTLHTFGDSVRDLHSEKSLIQSLRIPIQKQKEFVLNYQSYFNDTMDKRQPEK